MMRDELSPVIKPGYFTVRASHLCEVQSGSLYSLPTGRVRTLVSASRRLNAARTDWTVVTEYVLPGERRTRREVLPCGTKISVKKVGVK